MIKQQQFPEETPDDRCTFATAKHIFKSVNRDQIVFRFQLPQDRGKVRTLPARILFEHDSVDIAFLKIDYYNDFDIPIIRCGIISSSEISWAGTPMLLIDLIGVPGFSGSPLILQKTSEVIGII